MNIRFDRIEQAQVLMRQHGLLGIMVMNHDDYRYFFGTDRTQPRAIIPFTGPPALVTFAAEEPELRAATEGVPVRIFSHVGEQIQDVVLAFRELMKSLGGPPAGAKPRVGMQLWFETPAFLVDLFRRVNPLLELGSSDPVMDELRSVKEPGEIDLMTRAQEVATLGMSRVRELLAPGARPHDIATEALYTMMKAGAERTATPVYVSVGLDTGWIHGRISPHAMGVGNLVVVDLTPMVDGYCANLARTFIIGAPTERQQRLLDTYAEMRDVTRDLLRPAPRSRASMHEDARSARSMDSGSTTSTASRTASGSALRNFRRPPSSSRTATFP